MTSLSFYGGVDEIGGNKILIKDKGRLFLDFGMSFSQAKRFLSEFLQPRKCNGILDFVELGLLPWIKGIYREDYLRHCGIKDEGPSIDGVLLSHSHMDHSAYIHHLREDIPIYMTRESYVIMKAIEETSKTSFTDLTTLKKTFHFIPKARDSGYKRLEGRKARIEREIRVIGSYEDFEVGEIKVKFAPVDHSLPGAASHIIETSEEAIVYTGDLRFHGRREKESKRFVKEARRASPTTMITEGTRIDSNKSITERDIEEKATKIISSFKGFVAVDYPLRDLDRLLTFYNVAKNTDRTLVVNLKQAYILEQLIGDYPGLDEVAIYIPRKNWGLIGESCACFNGEWIPASEIEKMNPYYIRRDYDKWEREFLDLENTITYRDLQEEPGEYIFRCDFFELKELIDIKPEEGIYIRSMTEPFDEEMIIDYVKVKNWLKHFNLTLIEEGMHASGHASGPEILEAIREIEPEKVYPVHTENKEKFKTLEKDKIKIISPKKEGEIIT